MEEIKILAIDPGDKQSGFVVISNEYETFNPIFGEPIKRPKIIEFGKVDNTLLLDRITKGEFEDCLLSIEMVSSYGMPVGATVFETCVYIGRFIQAKKGEYLVNLRRDIKLYHCGKVSAKDSHVITSLVDRFENRANYGNYGKGTKNNRGYFFGFSKDIWQAFALSIYTLELWRGNKKRVETSK